MCGLEGVAGDCSIRDERVFKTMLIWNQIRGFDSTGVAAVSKHGTKDHREIRLAKELGPPTYLMDTKSFDKCFYGQNQVFLGHNRSKTTGEITRRNAHPFLFDDVVGAHNGTISLASKNRMDGGSNFKTDSEAIFNNIQLHGVKDTISRIDKGADNAFALTWYDKRDNTFNILRNEHRPLLYIYSKSRRTLYYSSLYETLIGALDVEDIDREDKPYQPMPDTWYRWVLPDKQWDTLPEPIREKVENRKYSSSHHFPGKKNNGGYGTSGNTSSGNYSDPSFKWPDNGEDYGDWEGYGYGSYQQVTTKDESDKNSTVDPIQDASSTDGSNESSSGEASKSDPPFDLDSQTGERQEIAERIQAAYKSLDKSVITEVEETSLEDTNSDLRKVKYDSMRDLGIIRKDRFPKVYESKTLIVHRDADTNEWVSLKWNPTRLEWDRYTTQKPPVDMPYTILDINARHNFAHEGKGSNKRIFFKGFKGSKLDQDHFDKIMQGKCMMCERVPEWGNLVYFVDNSHNYLCEYCGMYDDGKLIDELIHDKKQEKKVG